MTRSEFELFLAGGMLVCALMALIALLRLKSKGASGWIQAAGFLAMGGTLWLLKADASQALITGGFVLVLSLLFADFAYRSAQRNKP